MKNRSNRVGSATQQGWINSWLILAALWLVSFGAVQAEDSLEDFELFQRCAEEWEGIGVSFDIVNGELRDPVTFRDRWEAKLKDAGQLMEMRGTTRAGGRRIGYVWRFRWQTKTGKISGEFENSEGVASSVEVKPVAEGKRIEIRTPQSEDNAGGMRMDIYLEDEDIVIESTILNAKGEEIYRAAARYRKAG